ncbi:Retrovirus-related Pol polyprotein from transposon TNT 1-94 [Senna tora]|uniref:Retrovirus-related Pol polyprotein from transposon TNT 1-94 n=1 Tax=Senna tora TaxID=362788 RepID=A0A834WYN6_9FABA|nr:Retrovirus-related Pol polyprotein from transposon TNT 1-94 [Senna tora]
MSDDDWNDLDEKALTAVQLCLSNDDLQEISNEDLALLLLCSLPPSHKTFRETIIYGRDSININDAKSSLISKNKLDNEFNEDKRLGDFENIYHQFRTGVLPLGWKAPLWATFVLMRQNIWL